MQSSGTAEWPDGTVVARFRFLHGLYRDVLYKRLPPGHKSDIAKVHAAGDFTVIVELTNHGKAATGKDYRNEYCFIFELENGKIRRVREYVDLLTVKETLMG